MSYEVVMHRELRTIGELARDTGVPASTVRFYERRGLLSPSARSDGNYRLFAPEQVDRVRFVRAAQQAGFTLRDIAALLALRDGDAAPCPRVRGLIDARLQRVAAELEHLRHVEGVLRRWLGACRRAERSGRCVVLEGLERPTGNCAKGP